MSWSRVRTLIVVTVVAALVWAFAEAESLRAMETTVDLVFRDEAASGRVIELTQPAAPGGTITVSVTLEGSTLAIDALVRRGRRDAVALSPGMDGVPDAPGEHTVTLRDALRNHPDLKAHGVGIKRVEPETVQVRVDQVATRQVRVEIVRPAGELDGLPEVSPALVKLVGTGRELGRLGAESAAIARIDDATWARLVAGRRETVPGVHLELPAELAGSTHARLDPAAVDITLTVQSRTASLKVAAVPVHVRLAPAEMARFDVEVVDADRSLIDVTVSGPAELVRQIEDRSIPLVAMVPLSFEELERGIPSKEAVFTTLPSALRFECANKTVRLKISKRENGRP